jgi:predicted Zn-dependent protease
MTLKKVIAILLLTIAFAACVTIETPAQTEYSLNITNTTWDHTTIRILLIPPENETWWSKTFIDSTITAVDIWNNALATFASEHQEFAYLSNIKLDYAESAGPTQDFDVYVSWKEQITDTLGSVGQAQRYTRSRVIEGCNVTLAAKDSLGIPLTDVLKQTIAIHEFGHALGLLHANYTDDVMFSESSFDLAVRPISTLDAYGVAQVFRWRSFSSQFNSSNQEPISTTLRLPSGIKYDYLNEPQQDTLTKTVSSFLRYIQTPEGLIMLIVFFIIALGIVIIISALRDIGRTRRDIRTPSKIYNYPKRQTGAQFIK